MSSVAAQLENVVEKTRKLLDLCVSLQAENDMLKLELQALKVALDTSGNKNKQLEEQLKALAVARSLEEVEVDKAGINEKILDTKQKINDFVREIDKCIELLR
ncbi:hypothetical protein JHJ32_14000 [Parapedobacter sp. ISTM3]|uniref:Phenylalanyl-tRNA synthetase subunit beta n=1 Tax=Parapedobacter luteus TaxID=623280 RepID=A0A1T5E6K1_9SPHI|nr:MULTISPECIES: hypothetical protein [Parapedobacter]MBK1441107.1 hypothetical protein [Parapedobacter sp. ISTM3]SKB79403.1 hypothetical protein SAMN05660226_03187 [Parapedobacter luteus]